MRLVRTVAVACLFAMPVMATSQRTFVASTGNDANTCARDQPCRSFAAAMLQTNPNGEVVAIDSAGYGPVTIAQSVTIVAPLGVHAGISVFTGDGVTINAGSTDVVVLRNLYINSQGGVNGIVLQGASALYIEHCAVSGFSGNNITLTPVTPSFVTVAISDTVSRQSANSAIYADAANGLSLSVSNTRMEHSSFGLTIDRAMANIRESDADRNSFYGFYARGTGGLGRMSISHSVVSNNQTGLRVESAEVAIQTTSIVSNVVGLVSLGGKVAIDACEVALNLSSGIVSSGTAADVSVANSTIADNIDSGVGCLTGDILRLMHNTIVRNGTGIFNSGGTVYSTLDNMVQGNGTNLGGGGSVTAAGVM